MAFISEVYFYGGDGPLEEYVEVVLGPDEDPADFVLSAYTQNGKLHMGQSGFHPSGEFNLSDAHGPTPHPDNSDYTVYVIALGLKDGSSDANEATGVALTDISPGGAGVIDFFSAASKAAITATEGVASGATSTNVLDHTSISSGDSYHWDIPGNQSAGDRTPGDATLCLTGEAMVGTLQGPVPAENLTAGDLVWTADNGYQPARWIGTQRLGPEDFVNAPKQRPVRISANALARGNPAGPLLLSPQHRVLIRSAVSRRMYDDEDVLIAAKKLCDFDGIDIQDRPETVIYIHLLFDRHEIVNANGALVESLYMGAQTLEKAASGGFSDEAGMSLPPDLAGLAQVQARPFADGKRGKTMLRRIRKNNKPLQPLDHRYAEGEAESLLRA